MTIHFLQKHYTSPAEKRFAIGEQVFDTLTWQTFASLLVPPLIINRYAIDLIQSANVIIQSM